MVVVVVAKVGEVEVTVLVPPVVYGRLFYSMNCSMALAPLRSPRRSFKPTRTCFYR